MKKRSLLTFLILGFFAGCSVPDASWGYRIVTKAALDMDCSEAAIQELIPGAEVKRIESSGFGVLPYWGKTKSVLLVSSSHFGEKIDLRFAIIVNEKIRTKESEIWVGTSASPKARPGKLNKDEDAELKDKGPQAIKLVKALLTRLEKNCGLNYREADREVQCGKPFCDLNSSK